MADGATLATTAPRCDIEAERAVLAAILLENATLAQVELVAASGDFYHPAHGVIFEAIQSISARREPVDIVTLAAELRSRERLNTVGGAQYLGELTDTIPTIAHIEAHARIVADHAKARRVEDAALSVVRRVRSGSPLPDIIAAASGVELATSACVDASVVTWIGDAVDEEIRRFEGDTDVTVHATGLRSLDVALCGGFRDCGLIVIGGRSSSGKTALMVQLAVEIAARGEAVLFVSLEMPRVEVLRRLACQRSGLDLGRVTARLMSQDEMNAYTAALEWAQEHLPLRVIDRDDLRPSEIRALALVERLRARGRRLAAVFVDYVGIVKPEHRHETRELDVRSITRALKGLAKELKCPVVTASQLKREVESRDPSEGLRMSDFAESSAIEAEADVALGIHRPKKAINTRELWVLKQRNGPAGEKVPVAWEGSCARFAAIQGELPAVSGDDRDDAPEGMEPE